MREWLVLLNDMVVQYTLKRKWIRKAVGVLCMYFLADYKWH